MFIYWNPKFPSSNWWYLVSCAENAKNKNEDVFEKDKLIDQYYIKRIETV